MGTPCTGRGWEYLIITCAGRADVNGGKMNVEVHVDRVMWNETESVFMSIYGIELKYL